MDRETAEIHLKEYKERGVVVNSVYLCPECFCYHLTKQASVLNLPDKDAD